MNRNKRRRGISGNSRVRLIAAAALFVLAFTIFLIHWRPARATARLQKDLFKSIERNDRAAIRNLIADRYHDRWDWSAQGITDVLLDGRSLFLALTIAPEDDEWRVEDEAREYRARITLRGTPLGPVAGEAVRRLHHFKEPVVFTWRKQSFLPWSWKLQRIDQTEVPDSVWGYTPGDFRLRPDL